MKKLVVSFIAVFVLAVTFLAVPAQLKAQKQGPRKAHCDAVYNQCKADGHSERFATHMYYSCYANS